MPRVSATIVTLNEAVNIERALRSLSFANEILVVDSGSTDGTQTLAARLGARVVEEPWRGYAGQKNFAAEQAAHDWILSLDADEEVSPALAAEIKVFLQSETAHLENVSGCDFPRLARYLGRWIHHSGWYPDRKVRLYHRRKARWVGEYVHESVLVEGETRRLDGDLLHYTCDTLSQHLRTIDRYTTLAAEELRARGVQISLRRLTIDPAWTFVRTFVIQQGFRDGVHGFVLAWMAALYTFLKYAKAWFAHADSAPR